MKRIFVFLLVAISGMLAWAGEQKKDVTERSFSPEQVRAAPLLI
jgi:hypothetical protein